MGIAVRARDVVPLSFILWNPALCNIGFSHPLDVASPIAQSQFTHSSYCDSGGIRNHSSGRGYSLRFGAQTDSKFSTLSATDFVVGRWDHHGPHCASCSRLLVGCWPVAVVPLQQFRACHRGSIRKRAGCLRGRHFVKLDCGAQLGSRLIAHNSRGNIGRTNYHTSGHGHDGARPRGVSCRARG